MSRRAARAFTTSIVTVVIVAAGHTATIGQQRDRLRLSFAPAQEGSPVSILSAASDHEFLYRSITVKNLSSVSLESVTFGVVLHAIVPQGTVPPGPAYRPWPPLSVSIGPGEIVKLDNRRVPSSDLVGAARAMSPQVEAELGIVSVKSSNGAVWEIDPVSKGGFGTFRAAMAATFARGEQASVGSRRSRASRRR